MVDVSSGGFSNASNSVTLISELENTVIDFSHDRSRKYNMLHRIRSKILDMDRSQSNISSIYRETLKTLLHMMGNFKYLNSKNELISVSCSHGNPERIIAKIKEKANIILPVITISQTVTENDDDRRRYSPLLINKPIWNDEKQRAQRVVGFVDRPITIVYKVNIWSKYNSDMGQIAEQIRFLFNPSMEVPTKFSTLAKANLLDETDTSETDAADTSDRVLRKQLTIEVQTYVPSPKFLITSTGEIESFNIEAELYKNS